MGLYQNAERRVKSIKSPCAYTVYLDNKIPVTPSPGLLGKLQLCGLQSEGKRETNDSSYVGNLGS